MNLKLNEVTESLTDQMLKEMGVDPQTINYEKGHKFCTFIKMQGFDTQKEFKNFMKSYSPIADV